MNSVTFPMTPVCIHPLSIELIHLGQDGSWRQSSDERV